MPTQSQKLSQWDQLPGQVLRGTRREEAAFVLEFENGHAEMRSGEPDMPVLVERQDGNTTVTITDFDRLNGLKIGAVAVTYFSETFSDRSKVVITFEDGYQLVVRSNISYVPVKLA